MADGGEELLDETVAFENLIGKAQIIFFSIGDGEPVWHIWSWPRLVRWSRLFTMVR